MTARDQKPARQELRGMLEELGDLVEDLGLVEEDAKPAAPPAGATPAPVAPALSAPPPPSAPVWRSGPEVITGSTASARYVPVAAPPAAEPAPSDDDTFDDAVPMWESAAPAAPSTPGLWEAFGAELTSRPARAWSPAAAMVVLEPIAPPDAARRSAPATPAPPLWRRRPHAFTVLTAVAVTVAVAVFAFSRLDLGRTTGPAQPVTRTAFVLDGLRTVAAGSPAQVPAAKTQQSFPANAPVIYLDLTYRNVTGADALRIVILLEPQHSGQPAVVVSDVAHRNLASGGEIAVAVDAPPGGFTPGSYEVRALHDGTLEQSTTFKVEQP